MNSELKTRALFRLNHLRVLAVGAALALFLFHRLGVNPVGDYFE